LGGLAGGYQTGRSILDPAALAYPDSAINPIVQAVGEMNVACRQHQCRVQG